MEITEVRIKLVERPSERLRAFCSITLDGDFVIRDLKIIDGTNGAFVAMPSRKLADRCPRCGSKNHLRAKFCNECGAKLNENRAPKDPQGRAKLHADVAHPINAECRERIQAAVVKAFEAELEKAKSPDYKPQRYDDFDVDPDDEVARHHHRAEPRPEPPPQRREPAPPPRPQPSAEPEEPAPVALGGGGEGDDAEGGFSDYNSLIADLKRDAAGRRERHDESRSFRPQGQPDPARQEGPRSDTRRPPQGDRAERSDRGGRPRQDRGPRDQGRGEPRGERPESSPPPPPPPPRPAAPPPPPPPPKRANDDDFGAGL